MAGQLTNMPAEQIASIRYQLDHLSDDRRPVLIGACWALWSLAVLAMGLRFYAKSIVRSRFQLEDGLLLLGSLGATGCVMNTTIGTAYGAGLHVVMASQTDLLVTGKLWFSFQLTYTFTLVLIKLSILLFFYRIFGPSRAFRIAVWSVSASMMCWFLATILVVIFQCTPIAFFWDKNQPGHCIESGSFVNSTSIINVIYTFILVVMPVPIIWKLEIPRGRRVGICGVFFLGGIVLVASIVRLAYLQNLSKYDSTYDTVDICIWSAVEPNVAVICACLPLMAPIFHRVTDWSWRKSHSGSSQGLWSRTRIGGHRDRWRASQQYWFKSSRGSAQSPAQFNSDISLTSHQQWAELPARPDQDSGHPRQRGVEMLASPNEPFSYNGEI